MCPNCQDFGLSVYEDDSKRRGMSSFIFIKCRNCNYDVSYTSKTVEHASATSGRNTHDINTRAVYAMRHCGVGLSGLAKFCGLLNMPPPITQHSYDNINKNLEVAAENIAKESMKSTVEDVKEKEGTDMAKAMLLVFKWCHSCCVSLHRQGY